MKKCIVIILCCIVSVLSSMSVSAGIGNESYNEYPGAMYAVYDCRRIGSGDKNSMHCAWHMENEWYGDCRSSNMYAITDKRQADGFNLISYRYSGLIHTYSSQNQRTITVLLNGSALAFDQPPIIIDGRTLVPMRAILEALGAEVCWDGDTQTATAYGNGTTVMLTIGNSWIYKNGTAIYLDVPSILINDRTLVPVRAVSEAFDCTIDWDGDSGTVNITVDASESSDLYNVEALEHFANYVFSDFLVKTQSDNYLDLTEDDNIKYSTNKLESYYLIDIDNDTELELVVISTPENEELYGSCLSIWKMDDEKNAHLIMAKTGQQSRAAYRYFVVRYNGAIYVLESTGENSSEGHISIRNLYQVKRFGVTRVKSIYYNSRSGEYIMDGQSKSEEGLRLIVNEFDKKFEIIISQFE